MTTKVRLWALMAAICVVCACHQRQTGPIVTPWGEVIDSTHVDDDFDLSDIQHSGEMIALTVSGPDTYFDYQGRHLGTHYLLCSHFAEHLGVGLRMEVCRDSAEMVQRLQQGEADLIACPLADDSLGWMVAEGKDELRQELLSWFTSDRLVEAQQEERSLLAEKRVRRHVYAPMLNQQGGVISRYDGLFNKYGTRIHWDWRLLAAQCYQESTFDPQATSWAGAKGLMQIMPQTADHLGLSRSRLTEPEANIEAATRYLQELEQSFSDIADRTERQNFVLAAYNGGHHHIRDAMALCQRDGKNHHRWADVATYVLRLSQPQYYQDPIVKNGYMRGQETVDYVQKIRDRYRQYRGVRTTGQHGASYEPQKAQNKRHREKY